MTDEELENFPTSESAQRMLSYVSNGFYDKSYVGKWLFQVMGLEYDDARKLVEELPEQMFPETATWGLKYHEIKWGLPVRENLSYEARRRLIYQKRDYRAPMTPYRMEQTLSDATGFDVQISDCQDAGDRLFIPEHPNIFKAIFMGEGTLDVKKAKKMLEQMKQSHTTFSMMDWVRYEFNNRNLERYDNFRSSINTAISFWGLPMWDGTHLMDGSIKLDGIGWYNLIPGIKYDEGQFNIDENIDNQRIRIAGAAAGVSERADNPMAVFYWAIKNYDCLIFDGSVFMDGKRLLNVCRQVVKPTAKISASIQNKETATGRLITIRNLAYFDGSLKMDGSRVFNSIYREEAL